MFFKPLPPTRKDGSPRTLGNRIAYHAIGAFSYSAIAVGGLLLVNDYVFDEPTEPTPVQTFEAEVTDVAHTSRNWNPCRFEDGSGQRRCIWDGRHMGNGHGISIKFTHHGSQATRISHRKAHRLIADDLDL